MLKRLSVLLFVILFIEIRSEKLSCKIVFIANSNPDDTTKDPILPLKDYEIEELTQDYNETSLNIDKETPNEIKEKCFSHVNTTYYEDFKDKLDWAYGNDPNVPMRKFVCSDALQNHFNGTISPYWTLKYDAGNIRLQDSGQLDTPWEIECHFQMYTVDPKSITTPTPTTPTTPKP